MEIRDVKTYLVHCTWRNFVLVRIYTNEGVTGIGECTAAYGVGSLAVESAINELKPLLIGQDPFNIEHLCDLMYRRSFWGIAGGAVITSAISGIEQALWDIKGKKLCVPVYELLGGRVRDRIRVYANAGDIADGKPEIYSKFASKVVEDGITAVKFYPFGMWEIASHDQEIINRIKAVRDAVGNDIDIMIDGGWRYSSSIHTAIRIGKKLERFDPIFYEEPILPYNIEALAKVGAKVNIPLAAGERIYTKYQFGRYLEKKAIEIAQPDVGLVGGILEMKKIAAVADTYCVPIAPHNCNGPVATAATLQIDACTTNFLIQEIFIYEPSWRYNLVDESPEKRIKNGLLEISKKPGIGVELNDEELAKHPYEPTRYTTDKHTL